VTNKKLYDKRAKIRSFEVGSYVYLFNPARKQGLSKKFFTVWSGPFRVTTKLSDLNYEILGRNGRKFVVHLNRLKACQGRAHYGQSPARKQTGMSRQKGDMKSGPDQEADMYPAAILSYPLASNNSRAGDVPQSPPTSPLASHPATTPPSAGESRAAERRDPTFLPSDSPRSSRELAISRTSPPVTRSLRKSVFLEEADKNDSRNGVT
jgi:hypothetical protein